MLAVLVGLVIGLVACGGGSAQPNLSTATGPSSDGSVTSTPASPTPSPSASYPADVPLTGHNVKPGEKPPVYPVAANTRSQAGANAFAEFFMKTFDWAYATTNSAYVRHYTGPSCGLCKGLSTGITKTAAEGHWYEGGRFTVHPAASTTIAPVTAPADYCSAIVVDETSQTVVDKTGKVINGDGAHTGDHVKVCEKMSQQTWIATYLAFTP
ncbi:MAG: DUF6318 family protein [Actinomycetota bacterium]|nr:DUF6318 family protein [Actinomycetota bacterium]MDQ2957365.1 DUF6318 family protein [Actinomycetota bacterium]